MEFLYNVLLVLHFVGWAIVLGGYVASIRSPGLSAGVFHGAATVVVAGIGLIGVIQSDDSIKQTNILLLTIKLTIAVIIAVLAFMAKRQGGKDDNGTGVVDKSIKHTIGALVLVNILIAVFFVK